MVDTLKKIQGLANESYDRRQYIGASIDIEKIQEEYPRWFLCAENALRLMGLGDILITSKPTADEITALLRANGCSVAVAAAAASAKNLTYVLRRVQYMQEMQQAGDITIFHIATKDNPADVLTKHLSKAEFQGWIIRAGSGCILYNTYYYLLCIILCIFTW